MFSKDSLAGADFSWDAALSACLASQLVYQNPAAVKNVARNHWGLESCEFIEVADTQLFVATTSDALLIAFRGTESVADWIGNLKLFATERSTGSVHRGFSIAFDVILSRLTSLLGQLDPANRQVLITGHSLGGALATIAAAEFVDTLPKVNVYTFGQPRLAKEDFQQFLDSRYQGNFYRFVNADDIVTRVPPRFRHVGRLFRLTDSGDLVHEAVAIAENGAEPRPLTEPEFEALQAQIKATETTARAVTPTGHAAEMATDVTMEGLFPSFSDHRLDNYIAKIGRFVRDKPRLDGIVEVAQVQSAGLEAAETNVRGTVWATSERGAPVLVRLRDRDWQPPAGLEIQSKLGRFVTARATPEQIEMLRTDPMIQSIEASRDAGMGECAVSIPFVHANAVHSAPLNEKGSDCLIGIIDSGIDVLHECFQDGNGISRIIGIWNQRDNSGSSPHAVDPNHFSQNTGTFYTTADIAGFVQGNPHDIPSALRDPNAHGTHVASIAAGRAVGTFGGGVAPESKIVVVIPNMTTDPADPPSLGYSNSHIDALVFSKSFAEKEGLPIAINVSLGMNAGAHDGLSSLEAAFDEVTNIGRDEGIAIVKSAGNERGHGGHAQTTGFVGITDITWQSADDFRQKDYIEVWFSSLDSYEFKLTDPTGNTSTTVSEPNPLVKEPLDGNFCTLNLTRFHRDNGDHQLQITIVPQQQPIQPGTWKLTITGTSILSNTARIDAWVERDNSRAIRFLTGDNDAMTLSIPGTARTVITVGASGSSLPLTLTSSSSRGLTRDNRPKPELCAPGTDIVAARSNSMDTQSVVASTGTSMAAPHVTGAIALAFSLRKKKNLNQLNAQQVKAALIRSANGSNGMHHDGFGFGVLDVAGFMSLVEN